MGIYQKFKEQLHCADKAQTEAEFEQAAKNTIKLGIPLGKKLLLNNEFELALDVLEEVSPFLVAQKLYDELEEMWKQITKIVREKDTQGSIPRQVYAAVLWDYIAALTKRSGAVREQAFKLLKDLLKELHDIVVSEDFSDNPSIQWRKAEWLRDSAKIYWHCMRTAPALKFIEESVQTFEECEDWSESATSLAIWTRFRDEMGDKEEAIRLAHRMIETLYSRQIYRPDILLFANEILESNYAETSSHL